MFFEIFKFLIILQFLKTQDEIKLNTLWSMLQLRDFIDGEEHKLTPWGRGLQAAMAELDTPELDESIYIGMELLRFKVLKEANFAPALSGAPSRGTGKFLFPPDYYSYLPTSYT
jgi:hypothetical protein